MSRFQSVTSMAETATLLANRATTGPHKLLFPQFVEGLLKVTLERFRPTVPTDWDELLNKLRQQKAEAKMATGAYSSGLARYATGCASWTAA